MASIYPSKPIKEIKIILYPIIMFRKNEFKKVVLQCVQENGRTSSRQVWAKLWLLGVSHKNVSMTLLKCKKQRLLERTLSKHGRVREYFYTITERGKKRLVYYREKEREVKGGIIEIDELVEDARKEVTPLCASSIGIVNCAETICNKTSQEDVFSMGARCATMATYLILHKHELISAFTTKKLLSLISPETSASIENALRKPSIQNLFDSMEMFYVSSRLNRLPQASLRASQGAPLTLLMVRRMRELHLGQWCLYCMLKEEKATKEMYRSMYEMEKTHRIKLDEKLTGLHRNISALASLSREFLKWHSTTTDYVIKTDLKIIEHLAKRATHQDSSEVLWVIHYYIECLEENRKLAEKVERLEEEIYSLHDHILRDPSIPISIR